MNKIIKKSWISILFIILNSLCVLLNSFLLFFSFEFFTLVGVIFNSIVVVILVLPLKKIMEEELLLKKAAEMYPVGTKFYTSSHTDKTAPVYTISGENFQFWIPRGDQGAYKKGEAIYETSTSGLVYAKGKWAKIYKDELDIARDIIYKD